MIGLAGVTPDTNGPTMPSVREPAESIKALTAGNVVDEAAERVVQRRATAEEPVTMRIRRRMQAVLMTATDKRMQI